MDITVTIPKKEYETWKEENLYAIKNNMILYFRIPFFPKNADWGDKCYVIVDNKIIGYHVISCFEDVPDEWTCQITDKDMSAGKYIVRRARTWKPIKPLLAKSHRGFRYKK